MSTEQHNAGQAPVHKDVRYEAKDIKVSGVMKFLVVMAVVLVASYYVCWVIYGLTMEHFRGAEAPRPAVTQGVPPALPPEPRLQGVPGHVTDPQQDLRDMLAADRAKLGQTRWVDEKAGIAEIPVEEAMKIIAEKGLPAVAAPIAAKKKQ